jgi:FkbM family methyltransferase
MIGFEPEPAEAAALQASSPAPWKTKQIIAAAVGGVDGPATLHVPPSPASASLLPHNAEMIDWFGLTEQHSIARRFEVDTRTLDALLSDGAIIPADYIKIDVEGAEGAILNGARDYLRNCLALRVEVSFLEQRVAQPLGWDVAQNLIAQGFQILDVIEPMRWRMAGQAGHPYQTKGDIPYSRPVLAQGDFIAVRDFRSVTDPVAALKLVVLIAAMGYFDFAVLVRRQLSGLIDGLTSVVPSKLDADMRSMSAAAADGVAGAAMVRNIRDLVPLVRSLFGGLPARR